LKDFVANREMSTVRLNWKTASEINNDFFIVERSFDGEDFREVEVIDGHGNSSVMKDYELVDYVGEYNGTVYYRLKQFDFDGQETYSVVRTAEFSNLEHNLQIMPNPSNGVCEIKYDAKAIDVSSKIVVYDTKGQVVYEFKRDNVYGINIVNLDLSIFNKGVYIVKVEKESGTVMNKLIKE
ncbi:MAG: T9SS type A sorting domain-containing protein, partial [Flavobacteriia bacterium]